MKAVTARGGIAQKMDQRKKARRRYLAPRRAISSQGGGRKFRLSRVKPHFQKSSERVPTGQTQEQNERLRRNDTTSTVRRITRAAGWTGLMVPLASHPLRLSRAEIGRNPSIPSGRGTSAV